MQNTTTPAKPSSFKIIYKEELQGLANKYTNGNMTKCIDMLIMDRYNRVKRSNDDGK